MHKSYRELIRLPTFEERFKYLKTTNQVGALTFGNERYLNQRFYTSREWRRVRNEVILRDNGCNLAIDGMDIYDQIVIHHIIPITSEDLLSESPLLINPDNLICCSYDTHNAIHYGDMTTIANSLHTPINRAPNDTCPWRKR